MRWAITLAVVVGLSRRIWLERAKLVAYDLRLVPSWLVVSGACYLLGLATCAGFWWLAMRDSGARPSWMSAFAAYFAGHLGKYVPGKVTVLVIRATMVRGAAVGMMMAAVTSAHETVLMMATGALVATTLLLAVNRLQPEYLLAVANNLVAQCGLSESLVRHAPAVLLAVSSALSVALGLLALPPLVSRFARLARRPFSNLAGDGAAACRWRTVAAGAMMIAVGWLLMGLSLASVLVAGHNLSDMLDRWGPLPALGLLTAMVALATVGGFVIPTPGGLGSREWILIETLQPLIGGDHAVVTAVVLRLVWIVAEVVAAGVFWVVDRRWKKPYGQPS